MSMDQSWDDRIASFWATADDSDPEPTLTAMRPLIEERPPADPAALYEWASVQDFLGRESEAIPLYRAALDPGLSVDRPCRCMAERLRPTRKTCRPPALDAHDHTALTH
jgi:hypothetical protein